MSVTIKDVARDARVSVATVSRVLNGKGPVLARTRDRIQKTISRLGYTPHGAARSLITRRTDTIGVLLPDIYGEFFSELIRGIDAAVSKAGFHLLVSSTHSNRREAGAVFRAMRGRVDGLIVLSPDLGAPALRASIPEEVPVVLLNAAADPAGPFDLINLDNYTGAVAMVRHLESLGRRRIAFVCGPVPNADAAERLRGYRDAMRSGPAEWSRDLELPGNFREDAGYRAGERIARMARAPGAIFAANDAMAIGCLAALREAGRAVPDEIALAGFDDIPIASFTAPPLTSVRVSIAALGVAAAERVLYGVRSGNARKRLHLTLPTTLIVRESTGFPPASVGKAERRERANLSNGRRSAE